MGTTASSPSTAPSTDGLPSSTKPLETTPQTQDSATTTSPPSPSSSPPSPPQAPLPSSSMPSYGLLVVSSLGIMGCGVAAGTYQAKHNTEGTEDWRKLPPSQQVKHWKLDPNSHFNPTRFAAKALAVGTVLCLSATGATAFVLGRAFNVNSVDEFISKMRVWAPAKKKELEVWLHIKPNVALEVEKRRVEKMTYDEEMDYWGDIVMKEEREKEARAAAAGAAGGVVTAGAEVVGTGGGKQQQQQQQQQQWWWPWRAKA